MITALATLTFLVTLWMLAVIGATVLEASGGKILAALKGQTLAPTVSMRPARGHNQRHQPRRVAPISVRLRAAA